MSNVKEEASTRAGCSREEGQRGGRQTRLGSGQGYRSFVDGSFSRVKRTPAKLEAIQDGTGGTCDELKDEGRIWDWLCSQFWSKVKDDVSPNSIGVKIK